MAVPRFPSYVTAILDDDQIKSPDAVIEIPAYMAITYSWPRIRYFIDVACESMVEAYRDPRDIEHLLLLANADACAVVLAGSPERRQAFRQKYEVPIEPPKHMLSVTHPIAELTRYALVPHEVVGATAGSGQNRGGGVFRVGDRDILKVYTAESYDAFIQEMILYSILDSIQDPLLAESICTRRAMGYLARPARLATLFDPIELVLMPPQKWLDYQMMNNRPVLFDALLLLASTFEHSIEVIIQASRHGVLVVVDRLANTALFAAIVSADGLLRGGAWRTDISPDVKKIVTESFPVTTAPMLPIQVEPPSADASAIRAFLEQNSSKLPNDVFFSNEYMCGMMLIERANGIRLFSYRARDALSRKTLLLSIAMGLSHLHRHRIIHCDFHTGQVIVQDPAHVKILDFDRSVAVPWGPDDSEAYGHTNGVQSYEPTFTQIAPEVRKGQNIGFSVDVYALGYMIFHVCTGGALRGIIKGQPLIFASLEAGMNEILQYFPRLHEGVRRLVVRCRLLDPAARPTVVAVHDALQQLPTEAFVL